MAVDFVHFFTFVFVVNVSNGMKSDFKLSIIQHQSNHKHWLALKGDLERIDLKVEL